MNAKLRNCGFTSGLLLTILLIGGLSLSACQEKGAFEQAGEEVDEAVDTLKNGEESTANKLDDAVDDVRDGINDAKDELTDK